MMGMTRDYYDEGLRGRGITMTRMRDFPKCVYIC